MNFLNLIIIAWKAIKLNKARSLLTMLGVIIGVASVITMLAIGEGSKASIKSDISSMGANMITVRAGAGKRGGVRMSRGDMETLTLEDLAAIQNKSTLITAISPQITAGGQVINGANNWPTSLYGVGPEYVDIKIRKVSSGSMFTNREVKSFSKVVVIGQTVVDNVFPDGENPIGKTIRFNKIPFKVIGVLETKGENTFGQDQDDIMLSPYTTVQKRILAVTHIESILLSAKSETDAEAAVTEVTAIMKDRHAIKDGAENDFNVFSMDELITMVSSTSEMLTLLLVSISSISLLIGGIGIMNIMYVSVKERTREIGLRLAVGGNENDILFQFLIEAFLISVTGGLIGVFLGIGVTKLVGNVLDWPTIITSYSILLSFFVCAITGVFFGYYPAKKAAALDPIQALRYE